MSIEDDFDPPLHKDRLTLLVWIVTYTICILLFLSAPRIWQEFKEIFEEPINYEIREDSVVRQTNIHYYPQFTVLASLAHLYPKDMRDTLACESTWRHYNSDGTILRGKDGEYGVAQFMWATFEQYKYEAERPELSIYKYEDQLWLMKWMWERDLKYHWTCWRKL